tara:strand:+ start:40 stop:546 length:507 start_codon:yes stop_codon:yes gene_type:complete
VAKVFLIMCAAILFCASGLSFAQSEGKIGYVDLSRAFDEYQKTKEFDKKLEKKGDIKQEEREKLVKEIRKMRDGLELLNEKAKKNKETDIEIKIRSLQEFDQETKAGLVKDRDDMVRDILVEMNEVIQDYGEKNSYTIILNERVLLYGDNLLDLTDEIIKILNESFKK